MVATMLLDRDEGIIMGRYGEKFRTILILFATWGILLAGFFVYDQSYVRHQEEYFRERGFRALNTLEGDLNSILEQTSDTVRSALKLLDPNEKDKTASLKKAGVYFRTYLDKVHVNATRSNNDPALCDPDSLKWVANIGLTLDIRCRSRAWADEEPQVNIDRKRFSVASLELEDWVKNSFDDLGDNYFDDIIIADSLGDVLYQTEPTGLSVREFSQVALLPSEKSDSPKTTPSTHTESESESDRTAKDKQASRQGAEAFNALTQATKVGSVFLNGEEYLIFTHPIRPSVRIQITNERYEPRILVLCGLIRTARFQAESHRLSYSSLIWAALIGMTIFSLSWPLFKLQYMNNKERFKPKHGWYLCLAILSAASCVSLMLLNKSYVSQATLYNDSQLLALAKHIKENVAEEINLALLQMVRLRKEAQNSVRQKPIPPPPDILGRAMTPAEVRDYKSAMQLCRTINYLSPLDKNDHDPGCPSSNAEQSSELPYPFFDFVLWGGCDGSQLVKFVVRPAATPASRLQHFAFFDRPISSANMAMERFRYKYPDSPWKTPVGVESTQPACYVVKNALDIWSQPEQRHIEELISPNTGEILVILSTPYPHDPTASNPHDDKIAMQSIAFRPMSLIDPVLPPHYSFAVIDRKCRVLFHANSTHNLRENFCDDSKDSAELLPWLQSGSDHPFDISYQGSSERAYLTELPIGPLSTEGHPDEKMFLLVFRDPGVDSTENVAVMLACAVPLGIYFICLLVIGFLYLFYRQVRHRNYPPTFVWPNVRRAGIYVQVLIVNSVMLILFWYSYSDLYEVRLLLSVVAVVLFAVFFTLSKLSSPFRLFGQFKQRDMLRAVTGGVAAVAGLIFLVELIRYLLRSSESSLLGLQKAAEKQDLLLFGMIAISGVVGFFLSGTRSHLWQWSFPTRIAGQDASNKSLQTLAEQNFRIVYVLAGMSLIAAVAIVPPVGFFKFAYDAVMRLSLKHDEIELTDRLENRKDRLRRYYSENVHAPYWTAKARLEGIPKFALENVPHHAGDAGINSTQLDRYDNPRFLVHCPPSTEDCSQEPHDKSKTKDSTGGQFDAWIDKSIVEFLVLPDNQYGSELSKLAFTSGDRRENHWETYWTESEPTDVLLRGNYKSQFQSLWISASYPAWTGLTLGSAAALILTMGVLFFWLIKIITNIFPPDRETPIAPRLVNWRAIDDVERDSLVLGRAQSGKTTRILNIKPEKDVDYRDMRAVLAGIASKWSLGNALSEEYFPFPELFGCTQSLNSPNLESLSEQPRLVVLDHFEFDMKDRHSNLERLKSLESLPRRSNIRRIILSTIDPLYFFADESSSVLSDGKDMVPSGQVLDRWVHALSKFEKVSLRDTSQTDFYTALRNYLAKHKGCGHEYETNDHKLVRGGNLRPLLKVRPLCQQFALWVYLECRCTTYLRAIGIQFLKQYTDAPPPTRDQLTRNIGSMADPHYHVIWSDLTQKERLVLYQLALDGWANPHPENERAIEELQRKGLITKRVMYRVMNHSFGRFVKSTEHMGEIRDFETEAGQSAWQASKAVLIAGAIGTLVWLLYTQADLFRIGVGYVAGIGALLTTAVNFVSGSKQKIPSTSTPPQT
jgi:hypothetical protein